MCTKGSQVINLFSPALKSFILKLIVQSNYRNIDYRDKLPADYYTKMSEIETELRKKVVDWSRKKMKLIPIPKSLLFDQILDKHKNNLFVNDYQVNIFLNYF